MELSVTLSRVAIDSWIVILFLQSSHTSLVQELDVPFLLGSFERAKRTQISKEYELGLPPGGTQQDLGGGEAPSLGPTPYLF